MKVLLKKQDKFLPEDKREKFNQQVVHLVLMLKTAEIRRECLEELIRLSIDEHLIFLAAQQMHQELLQYVEKNELDFENKLVAQMCARIMQVCQCYIKVKGENVVMGNRMSQLIEESENPPDIQQLTENLGGWSGNEVVVARILSLLAFRKSVLKFHIKTGKSDLNFDFSISEMLSHFTLYYSHLVKRSNIEIFEKLPLEIILMNKEPGSEKTRIDSRFVSFDRLSRFLFNGIFTGDHSHLDYLLTDASIYPSNLLLLIFTSWLNTCYSDHWRCWENFSQSLFKIVDTMNDIRKNDESLEENLLFDSTSLDDRLLSPSWIDIIELIYKSTNITSALIAVNMIKSLINKFKLNEKEISELNCITQNEDDAVSSEMAVKNADLQSTHSILSSDNDWETLHMDKENLSLLTKQLEDLFLLDMLLKSNLCSSDAEQQDEQILSSGEPKVTSSPSRPNSVSLSFILGSGPGIVSEIVARWAVHHKVPPELLICSPSADANSLDTKEDTVTVADESTKLKGSVFVSLVLFRTSLLSFFSQSCGRKRKRCWFG